MPASYCCFLDPREDFSRKTLADTCPICQKPYGFPLTDYPSQIGDYPVVEPINRGFYSAAFVAEDPQLGVRRVLKVIPRQLYEFFEKDFPQEVRFHARLAIGTQHLVKPVTYFDTDIQFENVTIPSHVAVLEYVDGDPLEQVLSGARANARTIAQIASDLFRILAELQGAQEFHNDLHEGNLIVEKLMGGARRADAIDPGVRVVAIDLNSVSDRSRSGEGRLGDIHWVAQHLRAMVGRLLSDPGAMDDVDYRLASVLEERAQYMTPAVTGQRQVSPDQCIDDIRAAFQQVTSPWNSPPNLRHFGDHYNAQTLAPWYVPLLLVDPNDSWLTRLCSPGPQIVTGMRGCGKTMLLRALELHARAAARENESSEHVLNRLRRDGYVGLYVSAMRLLDTLGQPTLYLSKPFERLFAAYALAAVRAVRHVADVSRTEVRAGWYRFLADALGRQLRSPQDWSAVGSEYELEQRLQISLVELNGQDAAYELRSHPSSAFPELAGEIVKCSSLWHDKTVLFLLDDVSTRYLKGERIGELLSALLFLDPRCAFKLTSEAGTLQLGLRTPGQVGNARRGRDYEVFDLGGEVYSRIKRRGKPADGREFVDSILRRRAKYYGVHPKLAPAVLLGDASLESIARVIASSPKTSRTKKAAYHGLTALARVCVGDIGDVISLYDLILKKAEGGAAPVDATVQSEAFQEFCSRRLYDLNRKRGNLQPFVRSFAEASHELLIDSYRALLRTPERDSRDGRLRQYLTLYVRMTSGDVEAQYAKIQELVDNGVFVFGGGSEAPRTKTKDSNPIQQFKLTFRKIYGLSSFIGLAESDRFELSGSNLEEWLFHPERGKDVLLRNLGGPEADEEATLEAEETGGGVSGAVALLAEDGPQRQSTLFERHPITIELTTPEESYQDEHVPAMLELARLDDPPSEVIFEGIVAGLGFEARTPASLKRLYHSIEAKQVVLVKYPEAGRTEEIRALTRAKGVSARVIDYSSFVDDKAELPAGPLLVDITGLAKPALFRSIVAGLRAYGRVWIAYTEAQHHFPLEGDLARVLESEADGDVYDVLERLSGILTGEAAPYSIHRLLGAGVDESLRRLLVAFASPKHDRLLSLLDERDYDRVEIVAPPGGSNRSRLARIIAEVAKRAYPSAEVVSLDSRDLPGTMTFLERCYQRFYVKAGFNFELGLTGSKIQAVAAAALASAVRVSEVFYVSPAHWDPRRFTSGVGQTTYWRIERSRGENDDGGVDRPKGSAPN